MKILAALLVATAAFAEVPKTLSLREAETAALQKHPRIQAARLDAEAVGQEAVQIRSGLFPNLFGSVTGAGAPSDTRIGAGALNNPTIFSRAATGFTASQLITDFGRTNQLVAGSRLHAAAEQANVNVAQADVLLRVDRAYFHALRAQSVLSVAEQTVKSRQVVADQVTALAQSKLKSALDVSFANVNLSEAKLLVVSAQNDVEAAFAELAAAMGQVRPERYDLRDEPLPPAPPSDFNALLDTALHSRPELASLRADEGAALHLATAEKRLWLPSFSAVTTLGVIPDHGPQLPGRYVAAGLNITIPVFNGHLFSARRQEAELKARAAGERIKDEELGVARDLRVAWLNSQTAYDRLDLTRQLVDQANQALDLAQARYDMGLSSIVELSQAQLAQTSAQISNVSAKYDYQAERAALEYQMGRLR